MKKTYFDFLLSIQTSITSDNGVKSIVDNRAIDLFLTHLSLMGYIIPVGGVMIAIYFCLLVFRVIEYNAQLLFREKFKLTISMLHNIHIPLILLRNQLADMVSISFHEPITRQLRLLLENTDRIIENNRSAIALDNENWKTLPKNSLVEFEVYSHIVSIVDRCRLYADSRQIQLKVCECSDYIYCRVNEAIMKAALQHLLNKVIEDTAPNGCINIVVSHTVNSLKLTISNCNGERKGAAKIIPFIPVSIFGYGGVWTVRKIIRMHGGIIAGYGYGKEMTYQIMIPTDCPCRERDITSTEAIPMNNDGKQDRKIAVSLYVILVMADKYFSVYLEKALSVYFKCLVIEDPDSVMSTCAKYHPYAIIIDDSVNGVYGKELCSRIKADETLTVIPVVLLIKENDSKSYQSYVECGANRLELRTDNIYKLVTDVRMLADRYLDWEKRTNQLLKNSVTPNKPIVLERNDKDREFINAIHKLLELNLTTEKFTIKDLCEGMSMSRTRLYNKMKKVFGLPARDYIKSYKMEKAVQLLLTQQHTIAEISDMLGFCDSKYFGKKFKEHYHVCPTKYVESILEK